MKKCLYKSALSIQYISIFIEKIKSINAHEKQFF